MSIASSSAYGKTKYSALDSAREVKDSIARVHDKLTKFVVFVSTEHLSLSTVRAYWQQQKQAVLKINTVSRELGIDVRETVTLVRAILDATADLPLPEFCANDAPALFAAIDSIVPDEVLVGDGRSAAARFQYAVELRTALLHHTLSVLSHRYPSAPFTSLQIANEWTQAFTLLLQEVEEIIAQTQQLLCDEATAVQSYLDHFRSELEMLHLRAQGAAFIVRGDWQRLLADTERQVLEILEKRYSRLATLAFGELRPTRDTGWLEVIAKTTLKRAPALGALLLTLAGGATLLVPALQARAATPLALPAPRTETTGNFPVLARHVESAPDSALSTIQDEVHSFFNAIPRPRGRVSLTIPDGGTLGRVMEELSRFGYHQNEILSLFGSSAATAVATPVTLDVRWSQGGRPLLLPPYSPDTAPVAAIAAPTTPSAVALADLTATFGIRAQEAIAASFATAPQAAIVVPPVMVDAPSQAIVMAPPPAPDMALVAAPTQPTLTTGGLTFVGDAKPIATLVVHYVQSGEDLSVIAQRYGTTADAITTDNRLATTALDYGQPLLVRVAGQGISAAPVPPPALVGAEGVQSSGSFPVAAAATTAAATTTDYGALVNAYGSTIYPSVDAMPEDLRTYYQQTVQEVADFFNVRPGDILGILQAENNNAGLRLYQPAVSSAGAVGVGQIVVRTWNGWANPYTTDHLADMRNIVEHNGLGFDWAARETWRAYQEGRVGLDALANTNADPTRFDNSIAGVAHHLADYGATRAAANANPTDFQNRLANAISIYNSGQPLDVAQNYTQSAENQKTTADYVSEAMAIGNATPEVLTTVVAAPPTPTTVDLPVAVATTPLHQAYTRLMDQYLGTQPTAQELAERVDASSLAGDVAAGKLTAEDAARQLWNQTVQHYLSQGRAAREAGQPLAWPYIYNDETMVIQQIAVQYLGHPLSGQEVESLVNAHSGNQTAITQAIATRDDARLFAGARLRFDRLLQRSERDMPIYNYEIAAPLQPLLAGYPTQGLSEETMQTLLTQFEERVRQTPEYRTLFGVSEFSVNPFSPMPTMTRGFGAAVDYQVGGKHTGVDFAASQDPQTGEPTIYAVEAGTVAYVGPLYCDTSNACRGDHAVVIDHGNDVYSVYSHNSASTVQTGQAVQAGQAIGRQGNEGYSFGSHLHFEVHTGAPFSGDWTQPFTGGQFEDPMAWLPR